MRAACFLQVGLLQRTAPSALLMLLSTGPRCHACFEPLSSGFTGAHRVLAPHRSGSAVAAAGHPAVSTFPKSQTATSTVLTARAAGPELKLQTSAASAVPQSSHSADAGFLASPDTSFTSLGLSQIVAEALHTAGFAIPASVQVCLAVACRAPLYVMRALIAQGSCYMGKVSWALLDIFWWQAFGGIVYHPCPVF